MFIRQAGRDNTERKYF